MSTRNPSAALAEAIAKFSKSAHSAFTDIETQLRQEVSDALAELHKLRAERDNAVNDLHAAKLECQSWKQEASAATIRAELMIAHQAETIAKEVEINGQLRHEVNQWQDQSRNWQEHFLRVEHERCALSSRIERHRQLDGIRASTGRETRNDDGSKKYTAAAAVIPLHQPKPITPPRSVNPDGPIQSTVIRRVQAIVHVKREDDQTDEDAEALQTSAPSASGSTSGVGKVVVRKRKMEDLLAEKAQPHRRRDSRRKTAIISDEEGDADDMPFQLDEEEDELMMGAEDNHDEVYGTHPVEPSRQQQAPKKRRKYSAR